LVVSIETPRSGDPGTIFRPNGPGEPSPGFTLGKHFPHDLALKGRETSGRSLLTAFQAYAGERAAPRVNPGLCSVTPLGLGSAALARDCGRMMTVAKAAGIAPEVLVPVLEHHAIRSAMIDLKLPKMLEEDYEPHFSLKHVQLGLDLATRYKLDLPATKATVEAMRDANDQGWADLFRLCPAALFISQSVHRGCPCC
jgi:hypothetical protein